VARAVSPLEARERLARNELSPAAFKRLHGTCRSSVSPSPQCGFATSVGGNAITVAAERAKLRTISETAASVWGLG
jgi:hypothetical protein